MRDILMPFFSASRLTEPVTEVSKMMSPPSRVWNWIGRRKFEIPTCWICCLAPLISQSILEQLVQTLFAYFEIFECGVEGPIPMLYDGTFCRPDGDVLEKRIGLRRRRWPGSLVVIFGLRHKVFVLSNKLRYNASDQEKISTNEMMTYYN